MLYILFLYLYICYVKINWLVFILFIGVKVWGVYRGVVILKKNLFKMNLYDKECSLKYDWYIYLDR